MQRNISGVSGVSEEIFLPEMIDNALQLALGSKSINYITIKKQLDNTPIISVDKSKLLQILINLIGNAKDAVDNNPIKTAKEISIVVKNKRNKLEVLVIDNGIGILPDNIDRIFSLGFTTKEDGHGYGLHSSALLAQEIGGSLKASSDGPGKGAIFTLILPKLSEQKLRGI
jgi:C4-dicarboxylate-specific signal transduction histidine kinase